VMKETDEKIIVSTSISIVNLVCYSQDLLTHGM
jgi:hypothetical protein